MFIKMLLFNLLEMFCIVVIGISMEVPLTYCLLLLLTFILCRFVCKNPKHYKKAYQCFVFSLTIFVSLFLIFKIHLAVSILLALFSAYILSGKADIGDMFLWKGNASKYEDIIEFVKFNQGSAVLNEFEKSLKERDNLKYLIYKYRFIEGLSFSEISDRLDISTQRITEELNAIALSARIFCKI